MKKLLSLILACVLCLCVIGCGGSDTPVDPAASDDPVGVYLAKAGLTLADVLPEGCPASDVTYVERIQQLSIPADYDYEAWVAQLSAAFQKVAGDSFEDMEVMFGGVLDGKEVLVSFGTVNDIFFLSIY